MRYRYFRRILSTAEQRLQSEYRMFCTKLWQGVGNCLVKGPWQEITL
jgi:hypothetical protein